MLKIGKDSMKSQVDLAFAEQVVYDESGETVAIATILTMVKKLDQSL